MTLHQLNQLNEAEALPAFLKCCGSQTWAHQMSDARPFPDADNLEKTAEEAWWHLAAEDWLLAFSQHPRIGEVRQLTKWSTQEQSGMDGAQQQTTDRLAALNDAYFERFGWIYIVCATGKSASEMLALLESRLSNEPAEELRIAAMEQAKIMKLRLTKLLEE
jgi:2-oxo-4-hydroxy-4-carboxy-5-ureidoimidazoline decarboxylase